jgi:heme exporter protein CcmB
MQVFFIIFFHELLILKRNSAKILANFLFFTISAVIFFLLAQAQENSEFNLTYSITVIWFSLLFSVIFSSSDFLKKDFEDGTIEQILTSVDNLEIFILAKMLATFAVNILPIAISSLGIGYLMEIEIGKIKEIFLLIILTGICVNFICCFCGSLSILGNSAPMISVIALPLIIPIMLISFSGVINDFPSSYKILLGLSVFSACTTIFTTAKIIKIAAD